MHSGSSMFYGYVLRSEKDDELYIGSTNDLKRRMRQHQEGHVCQRKLVAHFFSCTTKRMRLRLTLGFVRHG
jgi:predicted GIY-YIG superfamily endonuclease